MTDIDRPEKRKTFFNWIFETKLTDLVTAGVSIATLLVTLNIIKPVADEAKQAAEEARDIAIQTGTDESTTSGEQRRYIVQLATYQRQNCSIANNELESYADRFEVWPALFETSDKRFVVVGIETNNPVLAQGLLETALELSEQPQFSKESLDQARIRHDPNWKVTNCE